MDLRPFAKRKPQLLRQGHLGPACYTFIQVVLAELVNIETAMVQYPACVLFGLLRDQSRISHVAVAQGGPPTRFKGRCPWLKSAALPCPFTLSQSNVAPPVLRMFSNLTPLNRRLSGEWFATVIHRTQTRYTNKAPESMLDPQWNHSGAITQPLFEDLD